MKFVALLGAGFSNNWGGWLASEAFEYLLGTPEVLADRGLRALLWRYHAADRFFEDALAELQQTLWQKPQPWVESTGSNLPILTQVMALQQAVNRMFEAMNAAYNSCFEFGDAMERFLANFDAIFTVNQDMLLERLYVRQLRGVTVRGHMWAGAILPGMRQGDKVGRSEGVEFWSEYIWEPMPEFPERLEADLQPIYKLHGSSQWQTSANGIPILIIGGEKSRQIAQFPTLDRYAKELDSWLAKGTRLMVIGYGFGDEHINNALVRAGANALELFIIDPKGPNVASDKSELWEFVGRTLIGASRRPIMRTIADTTVVDDPAERAKVMRFFDT